MFKSILPKNFAFFDYFADHAHIIHAASEELLKLTSQGGDVQPSIRRIKMLEHEADALTHTCIDALHRTFITPVDRPDIHKLIKTMDDVVDCIDAAVIRVGLYEIVEMREESIELARILIASSEAILAAVQGLRDLKNREQVLQKCVEIHELENKGDEVQRAALRRLFRETDAVLIIKWKDVFERLEKSIDRADDVANIVEGIVISAS